MTNSMYNLNSVIKKGFEPNSGNDCSETEKCNSNRRISFRFELLSRVKGSFYLQTTFTI